MHDAPRSGSVIGASRPPRGRALAVSSAVAIAVNVAYLVWRAVRTGGGADPWWFGALLAAETIGVARLIVELVLAGSRRAPVDATAVPPRGVAGDRGDAQADVVFVVHDEPLRTVRSHLLAASRATGVRRVDVIDRPGRASVADLAARLGCAYDVVGPLDDARGRSLDGAIDSLERVATRILARGHAPAVLVVDAAHSVRPDVVTTLARALDERGGAVFGACDEVNVKRGVDRNGMGEGEFWQRAVHPRLATRAEVPGWDGVALIDRVTLDACGGLRSADGTTFTHTARVALAAGVGVRAVPAVVSRRLAPGSVTAACRRYAVAQRERLAALRAGPLVRFWSIAGLAERAAAIVPARILQRVLVLSVVWAVLLGSARPLRASTPVLALAWAVRVGAGRAARARCAGRDIAPWVISDARVLPVDLAVSAGLVRRRAGAVTDRSLAAARWCVRLAHGATSALILAVAAGFVRVGSDPLALMALGVAITMLGASSIARRELRQVQFRRWHRSDAELEVLGAPGFRVVGLSPFGFDVLSPSALAVGTRLALEVIVAIGDGRRDVAALVGEVERSGTVDEGCAAYVRFAGIDVASEDLVLELLAVGASGGARSTSDGGAHDWVNVA